MSVPLLDAAARAIANGPRALADEQQQAEALLRDGAPNEQRLLVWREDCRMEAALERGETPEALRRFSERTA